MLEVRRAVGAVSARDLLRLVNHIGKRKAVRRRERLHIVKRVSVITLGIVRHADPNLSERLSLSARSRTPSTQNCKSLFNDAVQTFRD